MQSLQLLEVTVTPTDVALYVLLGTALVSFVISAYRLHRNPANSFNLLDLLMENGRVSKLAVAFMVTLVVTSWVILKLAIDSKLTEGYLTIYVGAWVTPIVAKLFTPHKPPPGDPHGNP